MLSRLSSLSAITVVLLWSAHGLGYRDRRDIRRPVSEIIRLSAAERDAAVVHDSLLCLDLLSKTKPAKAIKYCDLALELDPKNIPALNLRGNVHLSLARSSRPNQCGGPRANRFRPAVASFSEALRRQPKLASSLFGRAIAKLPAHSTAHIASSLAEAIDFSASARTVDIAPTAEIFLQ